MRGVRLRENHSALRKFFRVGRVEIFALAEIFSSDHFHGQASPTLVIRQDEKKVWRRLRGCCGGRGLRDGAQSQQQCQQRSQ